MSRAGAQNVEEYVELLDKDPQVLEDFKIVLLSMFRSFFVIPSDMKT